MTDISPKPRPRSDISQATVGLRGIWAAKLWIVLPAAISIPVMWIFGEGDYIVPFLCISWAGCFVLGQRFYKASAVGTVRESIGLHTMVWSAIFALMTLVWTLALVVDGNWRWTTPGWW